jgi:hypothetical protein
VLLSEFAASAEFFDELKISVSVGKSLAARKSRRGENVLEAR